MKNEFLHAILNNDLENFLHKYEILSTGIFFLSNLQNISENFKQILFCLRIDPISPFLLRLFKKKHINDSTVWTLSHFSRNPLRSITIIVLSVTFIFSLIALGVILLLKFKFPFARQRGRSWDDILKLKDESILL